MSIVLFSPRYWFELALFLLLGFVAIGLPIVPFGAAVGGKIFPDLLFCLVVAWMMRHPTTGPVLFVLLLAVVADVMLMRPLGLWAILLLSGSELLRYSERSLRGVSFILEWIYISLIFVILQLLQNFVLYVAFAETYEIGTIIWYSVKTSISYPFVVIVLHWVLRIRAEDADTVSTILGLRR